MAHSWGDSWPYWNDLYKAEKYFCDLFERCTHKRPSTKEKWGTIRYVATWSWVETFEQARIFRECIRRTIKKFPNVACEIVSDAAHVLEDVYFEGWCNGVMFASKYGCWFSSKRPRGV